MGRGRGVGFGPFNRALQVSYGRRLPPYLAIASLGFGSRRLGALVGRKRHGHAGLEETVAGRVGTRTDRNRLVEENVCLCFFQRIRWLVGCCQRRGGLTVFVGRGRKERPVHACGRLPGLLLDGMGRQLDGGFRWRCVAYDGAGPESRHGCVAL